MCMCIYVYIDIYIQPLRRMPPSRIKRCFCEISYSRGGGGGGAGGGFGGGVPWVGSVGGFRNYNNTQ